MNHYVTLALAVLALAIAIVNLVRGERSIRKYKRDTAALERTLPERSVADEFDLTIFPPDEPAHTTFIGVDMTPEEFDPDDLTKGGSFSFPQERLVDPEAEMRGDAVPHYPNVSDLAEAVDHQREARGSS